MTLIFLPFALFEAKITFKGFLKLQENIYSFPGRVAFFACQLEDLFFVCMFPNLKMSFLKTLHRSILLVIS